MAEVVTMPGVVRENVLAVGEPCPEVISRLEALLARARRGEIARISYAAVGHGSDLIDWAGTGFWDQGFAAVGDLHHALACARQDERLGRGEDIV